MFCASRLVPSAGCWSMLYDWGPSILCFEILTSIPQSLDTVSEKNLLCKLFAFWWLQDTPGGPGSPSQPQQAQRRESSDQFRSLLARWVSLGCMEFDFGLVSPAATSGSSLKC